MPLLSVICPSLPPPSLSVVPAGPAPAPGGRVRWVQAGLGRCMPSGHQAPSSEGGRRWSLWLVAPGRMAGQGPSSCQSDTAGTDPDLVGDRLRKPTEVYVTIFGRPRNDLSSLGLAQTLVYPPICPFICPSVHPPNQHFHASTRTWAVFWVLGTERQMQCAPSHICYVVYFLTISVAYILRFF